MQLGATEIILILIIALLFFGPTRLPGLGKSLGETIRGFKKAMDDSTQDSNTEKKQSLQDHASDDAPSKKS